MNNLNRNISLDKQKGLLEKKLKDEVNELRKDSINFEIAKIEEEKKFNPFYIFQYEFIIDSLNHEIHKVEIDIKSVQDENAAILNDSSENEKLEAKYYLLEQELWGKAMEPDTLIRVQGYKFWWLSFEYGAKFNGFRHFVPTSNTITTKSNDSHIFGLNLSFYNLTMARFLTMYCNLGFTGGFEDNFNDLSKVEINERTNFGVNPDDRYVVKSITPMLEIIQKTYLLQEFTATYTG
ncbi:MAG: hypothetical protein IPN76_17005 [Saprospiraceae bacterium]|nr:hypothetical protein [Saprospiraceae bacterium]